MRPYGGLINGSPCTDQRRRRHRRRRAAPRPPVPGHVRQLARPPPAVVARRPAPRSRLQPAAHSRARRQDVAEVGFRRVRLHQTEPMAPTRRCTACCVSGSSAPPCQLAPPVADGRSASPSGPGHVADDRRREDRSDLVAATANFTASACSSGVKSIRSSSETPWRSNAGGLVDERLRRRIPLAGHVALFDRPLFDRPHRLAGWCDRTRRPSPAWSAARSP